MERASSHKLQIQGIFYSATKIKHIRKYTVGAKFLYQFYFNMLRSKQIEKREETQL
jgi:hypothetical protein